MAQFILLGVIFIGFWMYTMHLKDVFFVIGQVSVWLKDDDVDVEFKKDGTLIVKRDRVTEYITASVGKPVYKYLKRKGYKVV